MASLRRGPQGPPGPTGPQGAPGAGAPPAGTGALGSVKLSHAAGNPANPVAVEDADPRNTNARTPTAHKTSHATGGSDVLLPGDIAAEAVANKGQANGYAGLDGSALVSTTQIPASVAQYALAGVFTQRQQIDLGASSQPALYIRSDPVDGTPTGASIILDSHSPYVGGDPFAQVPGINFFKAGAWKWQVGMDSKPGLQGDLVLGYHWNAPDPSKSLDVIYLTDEVHPKVAINTNREAGASFDVTNLENGRHVVRLANAGEVTGNGWMLVLDSSTGVMAGFDKSGHLKIGAFNDMLPALAPLQVAGQVLGTEFKVDNGGVRWYGDGTTGFATDATAIKFASGTVIADYGGGIVHLPQVYSDSYVIANQGHAGLEVDVGYVAGIGQTAGITFNDRGLYSDTGAGALALNTGDVRIDGAGKGVIVKSPDGLTTKRIGINNAGALTLT